MKNPDRSLTERIQHKCEETYINISRHLLFFVCIIVTFILHLEFPPINYYIAILPWYILPWYRKSFLLLSIIYYSAILVVMYMNYYTVIVIFSVSIHYLLYRHFVCAYLWINIQAGFFSVPELRYKHLFLFLSIIYFTFIFHVYIYELQYWHVSVSMYYLI